MSKTTISKRSSAGHTGSVWITRETKQEIISLLLCFCSSTFRLPIAKLICNSNKSVTRRVASPRREELIITRWSYLIRKDFRRAHSAQDDIFFCPPQNKASEKGSSWNRATAVGYWREIQLNYFSFKQIEAIGGWLRLPAEAHGWKRGLLMGFFCHSHCARRLSRVWLRSSCSGYKNSPLAVRSVRSQIPLSDTDNCLRFLPFSAMATCHIVSAVVSYVAVKHACLTFRTAQLIFWHCFLQHLIPRVHMHKPAYLVLHGALAGHIPKSLSIGQGLLIVSSFGHFDPQYWLWGGRKAVLLICWLTTVHPYSSLT